jgi:hypothetical protein
MTATKILFLIGVGIVILLGQPLGLVQPCASCETTSSVEAASLPGAGFGNPQVGPTATHVPYNRGVLGPHILPFLTPGATPVSAYGVGALIAHVRLVAEKGIDPADPLRVRRVDLGPAAGAVVRVELPGQAGSGLQTTADATGTIQTDLPAGRYWVFVPWSSKVPGLPGATADGQTLPDGRPVLAWAEAVVTDRSTTEINLTITIKMAATR